MSLPFDDSCPLYRAETVIGEKWTALILRELFRQGTRRFQDFIAAPTGIPPNTLSARLKRLVDQGVVERRLYSDHPPRYEYVLTKKGRALGPILEAMKTWGERYPP